MRRPRWTSLRFRIAVAFTAFGLILGGAFAALAWASVHGFDLVPRQLATAAVAGAVAIGVVGGWLGRLLARRVVAPVEELDELIATTRPDQLADVLAARSYDRELTSLAACLEDSMRRLGESVEREQRFTRFASHELRSPVAVIRGATELLAQMPEVANGPARRPLERIERSVADMESILSAFVWLGKEQQSATGERTDVASAIGAVVERYRHLLGAKPVAVDIGGDARPTVAAPPAVFDLIVGNLIANAFHFTEAGSVDIAIEPGSVTVTDTGPGMPAADLERAGDSVVRGDRSVGYGLGLSIATSLAERFGWRIWLDSAPGRGTSATVYFAPAA